ncbi:MAG: hypothetical protein Q9219_007675 [cf. Caloplaca sp. 3 TL-2023]
MRHERDEALRHNDGVLPGPVAQQVTPSCAKVSAVDKQQESIEPFTAAQRRSLFVYSLPASATTDGLTELFSQSYPLKHATVVSDPTSNLSKGYGFVTFAASEDALAALKAFDGVFYDGKRIKVELAVPRSRLSRPADQLDPILLPRSAKFKDKTHHEPPHTPGKSSSRLIVRNLPWSINTSEALAGLFRCYGKVKQATVPCRRPGLPAGFGFVLLRGRKNAEKALKEVNGKTVDGRNLAVDWAIQKDTWDSLHRSQNDDTAKKSLEASEEIAIERADPEFDGSGTEVTDLQEHNADAAYLKRHEQEAAHCASSSKALAMDRNESRYSSTVFIRNVPFTATDDTLSKHFALFGPLQYAKVVVDPSTGQSKGTAFICFSDAHDANACLQDSPKAQVLSNIDDKAQHNSLPQKYKKSVLENPAIDPYGRYTIDGRVLQISRAVDRGKAAQLAIAGHTYREIRDKDKRRLYLLNEGTISSNTVLYDKLSPSEISLRAESVKQRQNLIRNNPALQLSLTRLSVRNLPRSITSKELKALAREAVVGFARDVKAELRQPISKEELSRSADVMRQSENARRLRGKGIVRQSKIIFEERGGGKVAESSGAGRSKGYGFIEYTSHRWALMGLRWLNGHVIDIRSGNSTTPSSLHQANRRLIVEFAIENAQVVSRRLQRTSQSQKGPQTTNISSNPSATDGKNPEGNRQSPTEPQESGVKRKRVFDDSSQLDMVKMNDAHQKGKDAIGNSASKQRLMGRKRMARKLRRLA